MLQFGRLVRTQSIVSSRTVHSINGAVFSPIRYVGAFSNPVDALELSKRRYELIASPLPSRVFISISKFVSSVVENALWFSSTLKKRRAKMNKHKLRKRKKLMRKNTKQSRN